MAKAIEAIVDQPFESQYDDDEIKTTFYLRSLSGFEMLECTSSGRINHTRIIKLGLTGWENFSDGKGGYIDFSQDNIGRLDPYILQDISYKLQEISMISEDERKN